MHTRPLLRCDFTHTQNRASGIFSRLSHNASCSNVAPSTSPNAKNAPVRADRGCRREPGVVSARIGSDGGEGRYRRETATSSILGLCRLNLDHRLRRLDVPGARDLLRLHMVRADRGVVAMMTHAVANLLHSRLRRWRGRRRIGGRQRLGIHRVTRLGAR